MGAYLSSPIVTKETASGHGEDFSYGISSHQGWRKTQEDAHIAEKLGEGCYLFGVFDGHGGAEVAKFCSQNLAKELKEHEHFQRGEHAEGLIEVFHKMDELMLSDEGRTVLDNLRVKGNSDSAQKEAIAVLREYISLQRGGQPVEAKPTASAMDEDSQEQNGNSFPSDEFQAGCTAVVALVTKATIYVANAGDSRAVLSRGKKAIALSEDHKPAHVSERERIVAAGGFVSEIGGISRVNGNLSLSRAIGDLRYKQNPELERGAQIITAQPDVRSIDISPLDDFLLLACDGIWDVLDK